ncbi:MAG: YcjF family protein [Leuconostoc suionicum]|uniref:YcjF family protein n=1 Tax=Leuconostoc suionicum TaxID=1511761 RepID=UPI003F3B4571
MNVNKHKFKDKDMTSNEKEFNSFFAEFLQRLPRRTAKIIQNTYEKSRIKADKVLLKSRTSFDQVFDNFLAGVDREKAEKCHRIIHAASLSAAIVGCSPIPFSDAFLLVPIQLTMMSRLHKLFGQSWSEGLGKSLSKELVVVGLGRSAVGNIIKFIPAVGTVSGAVINASVAVSITEALGWVTVKMLNDGEDIFEQAMSFRGQFEILFKALRKAKK